MTLIKLRAGDWALDGHGQTDVIIVDITGTFPEFKEKLIQCMADLDIEMSQNGWWKEAFSFRDMAGLYEMEHFFMDSEDNRFPTDLYLEVFDDEDVDTSEPYVAMDSDMWFRWCLGLVEKHDPDFEYEIVNFPGMVLGGYGLFSF